MLTRLQRLDHAGEDEMTTTTATPGKTTAWRVDPAHTHVELKPE